jgi:hypothetical protein
MKRKYHVFEIQDYKGGCLYYQTNLTKKEFIFELYYLIQNEENLISEMTEEDLFQYINSNTSIYTGLAAFTFELFKFDKNNKLVRISIYDFIPDIIKIAIQEEKKENE